MDSDSDDGAAARPHIIRHGQDGRQPTRPQRDPLRLGAESVPLGRRGGNDGRGLERRTLDVRPFAFCSEHSVCSTLCVDAIDPLRVYLTTSVDHVRSDDGLQTFTSIGPTGFDNNRKPITCHPTHGAVLYASSLLSQDAGSTWNTWSDESLGLYSTVAFIVPGDPKIMFMSGSMTAMGIP